MAEIYRPIDVLELQVAQIKFWQSNRQRAGYDESFKHLLEGKMVMFKDGSSKQLKLSSYLAQRFNVAETIFVRSNIVTRLWDFTDVYQAHEHETLQQGDLPCDHGFAYLEHCIHIIDGQGKVNSIRAILWDTESNGVMITMFGDIRDIRDDINRDQAERFGKDWASKLDTPIPPFHCVSYTWGQRIQNLTLDQFTMAPTLYDEDNTDEQRRANYAKNQDANVRYTNRFNSFVVSLWEFMQQQIPMRMPADRPMRKRLARAHSPVSEVSVIQLRPYEQPHRFDDPDRVPQDVVWSHRWRVREHKRRWIDKKTGELRETTVSAHVKGPEHLPLIEKDRVFHVKK